MKIHTCLRNRAAFGAYLMLVLIVIAVNILCLYPLSEEMRGTAIVPVLCGNLLFSTLLPLLWHYIRLLRFERLPAHIRFVNQHLPALFILIISAASSLAIAYWTDSHLIFVRILPIEVFMWILLYVIAFQYWQRLIRASREEIDEVPENEAEECVDKTPLLDSFAVKHGRKLHVVMVADILYLQAYGDYVTVVTAKGKFLKEQTLKYFEANLPQEWFVRIHRSYIVNIRSITSIERQGKEQYTISLYNKERIKSTANGYRRLKEMLKL